MALIRQPHIICHLHVWTEPYGVLYPVEVRFDIDDRFWLNNVRQAREIWFQRWNEHQVAVSQMCVGHLGQLEDLSAISSWLFV